MFGRRKTTRLCELTNEYGMLASIEIAQMEVTMQSLPQTTVQPSLLKKIILRATRIPFIFLMIACGFISLSYMDDIFPLAKWKNVFDWTDKIGNMFVALAILTFIYKVIILTTRWFERKLSQNHKIASLILAHLRKGLRAIFILIALRYIIVLLNPTDFYLNLSNNIINSAIIIFIGWMGVQIFYAIEAVSFQYMMTLSDAQHNRAKSLYNKMHIIRNIATVIIAIVTIAAILMSFSSVRNIGISLLASAGFLTAIVGLATQKTLFSLSAGIQIALAQPIKLGDIVVVEGESGLVEEITFTYVTLKLGDRRRLVIPIAYFIEKPFENWSREYDSLRSSFHFYVDYLMPLEPLRVAFEDILKQSPFWDGRAYKLQVADLKENTVELRIQVSAANADNLSDLRAEVREKMLAFVRENFPNYLPKMRLQADAVSQITQGAAERLSNI